MLVLSRKNQESVLVVGPHGNECLLEVTGIEIQGRRDKQGFEAEDHVPLQHSEVWEQTPVGDQPQNRPPTNEVTANEPMDRWDDDGRGNSRRNRHRSPFRAGGTAGLAAVLVAITAVAIATAALMLPPASEVPAAAGVNMDTTVNRAGVSPQ